MSLLSYLQTKFLTPSSSGKLITAVKLKVKLHRVHMNGMFLFHIHINIMLTIAVASLGIYYRMNCHDPTLI
jgi:hypothetical protein